MITRVSIQNYKSLADVTVDLGPLTVLVGGNGSGKSNFVDALSFVADVITKGVAKSVSDRDGGQSIISSFHDSALPVLMNFSFLIEDKWNYSIGFIGIPEDGVIRIETEEFRSISDDDLLLKASYSPSSIYDIDRGMDSGLHAVTIRSEFGTNKLPFRASSFFSTITRYFLHPDKVRNPQRLIETFSLSEDGSNMNSILRDIRHNFPDWFERLLTSFSTIVPDIVGLNIESLGSNHLLGKITHRLSDDKTQTFEFSQESDGTLRVLGLLTALYQQPPPAMIMIEEPELYIHPGALQALLSVIREASLRTQIIITTHSPDMISYCDLDELRIVEKIDGATIIAPIDENQREVVNKKLFVTGDLLRIEGLHPQRPE